MQKILRISFMDESFTVLAFAVEGMSSTWPLSQRSMIFSPWETFPEGGKYRSGTTR